MATQPNIFEIEDPATGKLYRMEADEGVSQDDALKQFESLGPDGWSDFEYQAQPQAQPTVEQQTLLSAPVPTGVESQPRQATKAITTPTEYKLGMDTVFDAPEEFKPLLPEQEQEYVRLVEDPNVSVEDINQYLVNAGAEPLRPEDTATIQEIRKRGGSSGVVSYINPFENLADQEYLKSLEDNSDTSWGAQFKRSILSAWADPATGTGMLARGVSDLFDVGKDKLREAYPNATEDELEEMSERYVAFLNRKVMEARERGVEEDSTVPWILGQFSALDVADIVPIGRVAKAGSVAGRIAEKAVEGAAAGAIFDAGFQGAAISAGAQDEFDPVRVGTSAALSGTFGGTFAGAEEVGRKLTRPDGTAVEGVSPQATISVPTGRKNSKKYKQELTQAQDQMIAKVNSVAETWTNAPEIEVHQNFSKVRGIDNDALGAYTEDGRVILNTEAIIDFAERKGITPDEAVTAVTFHEALGHHGLTQQFGDELDDMLDVIYQRGTPEFKSQVDKWLDKHPNSYRQSPTNAAAEDPSWRLIRATEEVLAEWSEKQGPLPRAISDQIFDLIKRFARQVGIDLRYSSREIRGILGVSQRSVISGGPTANAPGSVKNMIVYHGGPRDFDRFDHRFMSTGEGNQIFGWGSYFSDLLDIARHYRNTYSEKKTSWRGVEGQWYNVRANAQAEAQRRFSPEEQIRVDELLTYASTSPEFTLEGATEWMTGTTREKDPGAFDFAEKLIKPQFDFVKSNLKQELSGKLYETELPDDARWLEWENELKDQPELKKALEDQGIAIVSDDEYRQIQTAYAKIQKHYREVNDNIGNIMELLGEDGFELTTGPRVPDEQIPALEAKADELFQELQRITPLYDEVKRKANTAISNLSDGQAAYSALADKFKSAKEASLYLADKGFIGNRYLADNTTRGEARKGDGTDKFNYVVFDDEVPQIRAKYMEAGEPTSIEDLTAEDLIESENAYDLLTRLTRGENNPGVPFDQIESEAILRGVKPSQVASWVGRNPGDLVRRLYVYDIAQEKLNTRLMNLKEKISTNGLTEKDQLAYLKTLETLEDVTAKALTEQSEIGRALSAIRKVNYTRKRMTTLKEALEEYGLEALEDPETFFKLMEQVADQHAKAAKKNVKGHTIISALNIPRAVMSSMDLSAPLRQGVVFVGQPTFWKSFAHMFRMLGPSGKANYDELMRDIASRPTYDLMAQARLSFSDIDGKLSSREEDFQSDLAKKIPGGIGLGVRQSEQAYAGFLNKLRADMFDKYVEQFGKAGVELDDNMLKGLGRFINSATGRAELPGPLHSMGPQLNSMFFSPRLIQSRLNMLNPYFYYKLPKHVRAAAITNMMAFGIIAGLTASGIQMMFPDDAEVETDMRSSDFGKIKVGNTWFDIGGGFNQYLTMGARTVAWLAGQPAVKTSSGQLREYGADKFGQERYGEALAKFFRNKLSPNASFVVDLSMEENTIGEPSWTAGSAVSRIIPMHIQSVYEAAQEYDTMTAIAVTSPGLFGVGVNTYTPVSLDKNRELEAPKDFEMKDLEDGENDLIEAKNGVVSLKEPTRELWTATLNNYFQLFIKEDIAATGKVWEELTPEEQAELISKARTDAAREAKADMMVELGLD